MYKRQVVDVGGGSTEVVLGEWDGIRADVQVACSVDVGCVRITERHLRADLPSEEDVGSAEAFATQALAGAFAEVPVQKARTWVGVAGTVTTLSAIAQELPEYDAARTHLARLSLDQLGASAGVHA